MKRLRGRSTTFGARKKERTQLNVEKGCKTCSDDLAADFRGHAKAYGEAFVLAVAVRYALTHPVAREKERSHESGDCRAAGGVVAAAATTKKAQVHTRLSYTIPPHQSSPPPPYKCTRKKVKVAP